MAGRSFALAQRGFTIIEIIVTVAIFAMIVGGVVVLVSNILVQGNKQGTSIADTDQARKLSFKMMQEMRNAVYGDTGGYPLNSAGDQEIIFFANVDGDSAVERVRYYLSSGSLYRGVINPTGNPMSYDPANELSSVVQKNVANGATPLFYYYNDNYDGTSGNPLAQPVNIVQVTFVKLNLRIYNKAASAGTYYTITSGASVRNLKTNLGD